MRGHGILVAAAVTCAGCDTLEDVIDGVEPPEASLARVDLIHAPTINELLSWQCDDLAEQLFPGACAAVGLGDRPRKNALTYSFDLVFDLYNPNKRIPIPLVEVLLGMNVFDKANLGAVCVSFCDPDAEDCTPGLNVEGACAVEDAQDVKGPEDLIPTVDELVDLTEKAVTGELGSNDDWRVVRGTSSVEAHVQFDLSADVMVDLAGLLLEDAVFDFLDGRQISIEVPFTTEGTLFFDVPELGRHAVGFGPWDDSWVLE